MTARPEPLFDALQTLSKTCACGATTPSACVYDANRDQQPRPRLVGRRPKTCLASQVACSEPWPKDMF